MSKTILSVLLLSFIGDQFYILFVSVVLLKFGYSSVFVAGAIAATVLPNLFLGPKLGRIVDSSNKVQLHTTLCLSLFAVVNILGFIVWKMPPTTFGSALIVLVMIIYNCLYSPLNSILYHYVIPSLDVEESKSFIRWEKYQAVGIILASLVSFILIRNNLYEILLPFDSITFVISAFIVKKKWSEKEVVRVVSEPSQSRETVSEQKIFWGIRHLMATDFHVQTLIFAALSVFAFIFAVDAQNYNTGVMFFKQLSVEVGYIPLIIAGLSIFNLAGSHIFEKYLLKYDSAKVNEVTLFITAVVLIGISICIHLTLLWPIVIGLILLQIIEPIWSTTNTVVMRTQIQKDKYSEFFGYFRIARSLVTSLGIFLYGLAQENNMIQYFLILGVVFIFVTLALNFRPLKMRFR